MNVPDIQDDERLGRRVADLRQLKKIQSSIDEGDAHPCPYQVFKSKPQTAEISVDRLDLAPIEKVAEIAKRVTEQNNKVFYGWGVIIYRCLPQGFKASPSPDKDTSNDYHADLYSPYQITEGSERKDRRQEFARQLAEIATWLPCPE